MRPVHAFLFFKIIFEKYLFFALKEGIISICILFQTFLFFNSSILIAQAPEFQCGTTEYLRLQKIANPDLESVIQKQESLMKKWINENYISDSMQIITIPVVVHIVYNKDEQNLPDIRVFEQIDMLNRDYAGLNQHPMWAFPDSLKANTGIQFCLAQRTPDGFPTNGIERRYTDVEAFMLADSMKFYRLGGLDVWDQNKYLNIWICNVKLVNGYAKYPYILDSSFGAVINYQCFGSTGAFGNRNNGGTASHEVGHCFNLLHIWGDDYGYCYGSDDCGDTPNQSNYTPYKNLSGVVTDSCTPESPGIMYMNFMDYTSDSCVANFTPEQSKRMRACFLSPNGSLRSLLNSDGCSPPTNIEEVTSELKELNIYPNPAENNITVTGITGNIKIMNIMGREVWNGLVNNEQGIDVSGFSAGIYYIVSSEKSQSANFLIMK
ncbi:MAG: M43 family zinc metalloprotease [bacterium]